MPRLGDGSDHGAGPEVVDPTAGATVFTDTSVVVRLAFAAGYGAVGYPQGIRAWWSTTLAFNRAGVPTLR